MVPLLSCQDLSLSFHEKGKETPVLDHISFELSQGEFLAIVGPSGCGKSTILNLISGLLQPEQGQILFFGKPLDKSQHRIGYMLQKDHLFEWRTIWKNILIGPEINHTLTKEQKAYGKQLLKEYGLEEFLYAKPSQLSGGMRQRAALIRTLVMKPEILLLDEPFSALDAQTRLRVSQDIGSIIQKEKITAILVTHDISEAISMADRVMILSSRPARLIHNIPIQLTCSKKSVMNARNAPEFSTYFNMIWKELNQI